MSLRQRMLSKKTKGYARSSASRAKEGTEYLSLVCYTVTSLLDYPPSQQPKKQEAVIPTPPIRTIPGYDKKPVHHPYNPPPPYVHCVRSTSLPCIAPRFVWSECAPSNLCHVPSVLPCVRYWRCKQLSICRVRCAGCGHALDRSV